MSLTIPLNGPIAPISGITVEGLEYFRQTCLWCLTKLGHTPGVELRVRYGKETLENALTWDLASLDVSTLLTSYNEEDAIEHGAMFIAVRLICTHTDYRHFERSSRRDGIDYWLSPADHPSSELPFSLSQARLEISGILEDKSANALTLRAKAKIKQTRQSNHVFPLFIVVVEFGAPRAEMVRNDA
jgi:hypothetical protein